MGITHVSCARGCSPFRPLVKGRPLPLVELPTTLPTLDEILGRDGVTLGTAAAWLADQVRPGELNVYTLHGEVEGRAQAPGAGKPYRPLAGPRGFLPPAWWTPLPRKRPKGCRRIRSLGVKRPGRAGDVAWQASDLVRGAA